MSNLVTGGLGGGDFAPLAGGAPGGAGAQQPGRLAASQAAGTYLVYCTVTVQKPWWREDPNAYAWQSVFGSALDAQLGAFQQARDVRKPHSCPPDALYYLSAERGLEQVPVESEAAWRDRLQSAWGIWGEAGSQQAHVDQFGWYGALSVQVLRRHEFSTPPAFGSPYVQAFARTVWSQFDVLVDQPHAWTQRRWGDGSKWGQGTWGSSMTSTEVAYFIRQLRQFRAGHDTCTYLYISFAQGRLWGTGKWGDGGTWGGSGSLMVVVVGEPHWAVRGLA